MIAINAIDMTLSAIRVYKGRSQRIRMRWADLEDSTHSRVVRMGGASIQRGCVCLNSNQDAVNNPMVAFTPRSSRQLSNR